MQQNNTNFTSKSSDDEISLLEIGQALAKYKWIIGITTIFFFLIGTVYAIWATPIYQSEALLAPTTVQKSNNRFASLTRHYSGLENFAGNTLPTHHSLHTAIAVLESRRFIQKFIRTYQLKPLLFPKKWDNQSKTWRPSPKDHWWNIKKYFINQDTNMPDTMEPNPELTYLKFKNALNISVDKKTDLVAISFDWPEPELASQWVNQLIHEINETLRKKAIIKSENSIVFLEKQLQTAQLDELRVLYGELIQKQIKNITLAQANEAYAFEILDEAIVPEHPIKPKRLLIMLLSLIIGLILGSIIALIKNFIQKQKVALISSTSQHTCA